MACELPQTARDRPRVPMPLYQRLSESDRDRRGAELAGGRPGRVVIHAVRRRFLRSDNKKKGGNPSRRPTRCQIPAAELTTSMLVLWWLMAVAGRVVSWWRIEGRSGGWRCCLIVVDLAMLKFER
ncbi:hypothetical protein TEQG_02656 [Trichophyton equinum CBS 127.97]|uniref:Uncharacterized protein n=1 Tax=Trichophyton equinum (strain ATCC MYA-4606 / CBS 127.97) TaxID=559882 RepID=F2PP08_TRIEC|nr:hypothetical protein TEQG_02656 [Trichophyton equinum CBS 127.97]